MTIELCKFRPVFVISALNRFIFIIIFYKSNRDIISAKVIFSKIALVLTAGWDLSYAVLHALFEERYYCATRKGFGGNTILKINK